MADASTEKFAPQFEALNLTAEDRHNLLPFFTNLDKPVFAVPFLPPEVIGALCSRTSRAKDDLRLIFLNEFLKPFLVEKTEYAGHISALIEFLHKHPLELIFANPKGREFYIKWLAQYGDDSIAQMAGTHLIYSALSQVAIKHLEDMRVGLAPIEKSTRYVDYGSKVAGKYRYYTDPTLADIGLREEYEKIMDNLFETYVTVAGKYLEVLKKQFPEEKEVVLKTKAYDTVRGLLPTSTLSQVSFFGNGQAFEYMVSRCLEHNLGEIRWAGEAALIELNRVVPAFLRRIDSQPSRLYRKYLSERGKRLRQSLMEVGWQKEIKSAEPGARLVDYDRDGEDKVIAGLIYPEIRESFTDVLGKVKKMSAANKEKILDGVLSDRSARWYKIPRAFENAHLRFEIVMNIGAWRDIHRHRMHTQFREKWGVYHGYDVPAELIETKLDQTYRQAIDKVGGLYEKIAAHDAELAQYAVTLVHRLRFIQYQNLRAFFWESELRTIAQGHPDYRKVEQEKVRLVKKIYPLLGKYILADMNDYSFARRETQSQIEQKEKELEDYFSQKAR
ncbi:MAG: FAD-dependent thymidylate synthase [Patescibacteria group bacterium]